MSEMDPKEAFENVNKRLRTMFNDIDELKSLNDKIFKLAMRVEMVEAKAQDTWLMCEDTKRSIPPSSEHMMNDLKQLTISLQNIKT